MVKYILLELRFTWSHHAAEGRDGISSHHNYSLITWCLFIQNPVCKYKVGKFITCAAMGLFRHHYKTLPRRLNTVTDKNHFWIKCGKAANLVSYLNNEGNQSYVLFMQISAKERNPLRFICHKIAYACNLPLSPKEYVISLPYSFWLLEIAF